MTLAVFCIAVFGVLLNALAQLSIKYGVSGLGDLGFKTNFINSFAHLIVSPGILAGLLMYAVSVFVWMYVLSKVEVSIAYPLLSIGYVLNVILAAYFFSEPITANKIVGITIIIFGVFVLTKPDPIF